MGSFGARESEDVSSPSAKAGADVTIRPRQMPASTARIIATSHKTVNNQNYINMLHQVALDDNCKESLLSVFSYTAKAAGRL
jgi:hypothetical protein